MLQVRGSHGLLLNCPKDQGSECAARGGKVASFRPSPQGMHGDGMRGAVGHMRIQCVCLCTMVGYPGRELWCVSGTCQYG